MSTVTADDELKKKKKHKKRSRWHFFHRHHKRNTSDTQIPQPKELTDEQAHKITTLADYAERNFSVTIESCLFQSLLESNDWNLKKSIVDLEDYEDAAHGILHAPPARGTTLLGSENHKGTSCYIDALLFAMYINLTTFDPLLTTLDCSIEETPRQSLQTLLRLFVNKLRRGNLIQADFVAWLRKVLEEASWHGRDQWGNWSQEDASELFMFLTELFDLPYLPFQIRLFHGANRDSDDDRVMTDRALSLSIPSDTDIKEPLRLEDILLDYFYNSMVTGVKRQVDYHAFSSSSTPSSPISIKSSNSIPKKMAVIEHQEEVAVTAWQVLELLPFYTAVNEQGEAIGQSEGSFPDSHMILPIVLKRYNYDHNGGSVKIKTQVDIPSYIHFNRFVNQNADLLVCPTCGHTLEGVMHLRSAVCHKGESPHSGHYIAFSRVNTEDDASWLKLDDMDQQRVQLIEGKKVETVFSELAKDAYILFYELDKSCNHEPIINNPMPSESEKDSSTLFTTEILTSIDKESKDSSASSSRHHHHWRKRPGYTHGHSHHSSCSVM
ncbi:ubiquitin carboxyl-terminal hydrolase-domain-containing protein [Radiomyces spectabilis]|uniref:ubiquitin carboxyl-terminal hydrolase-domain-containing protein n=1 Tax=Radiomyces spectabilis TaxID=64574 RepID=UPI00221ECB35|nr:ubiquitin carboxyl-terminal hydrolase-domain-containing protein [Radiomyces spectabilis]KAI8384351.1 ubiquitin carboxyl-terminal hydrolase-domain-containing protein [Radiomyces spectabilis]